MATCLLLAALFAARAANPLSDAPVPVHTAAAHSHPSQSIETIRVGQRVLTAADDSKGGVVQRTAIESHTWRRLRLQADNRWDDGAPDVIDVETLQPPEWVAANHAQPGAFVPLPLEFQHLGLPPGLTARVVANEPCPPLAEGAGRVVLTTVNHLNNDVWELSVTDSHGESQTIRSTGVHKFYSVSRGDWISASELRPDERLSGVAGEVRVRSLCRLPGIHRVYNMTVEDEHVYRVSTLGVLVHNVQDCGPRGTLPRAPNGDYLPDPEATGPHTVIGQRVRPSGPEPPYTQGATFDENGEFAGRTDMTDHGRFDHPDPHFHPATSPNSVGPMQPIPGT
jgi:hypothetical protein